MCSPASTCGAASMGCVANRCFNMCLPYYRNVTFYYWDRRVSHGGHAAALKRWHGTIAQRASGVQAALRGLPRHCMRKVRMSTMTCGGCAYVDDGAQKTMFNATWGAT